MSLWTPEEKQIVVPELIKGRSMVGYSRRGFLGMIAAAAGAIALPPQTLEPKIGWLRDPAAWAKYELLRDEMLIRTLRVMRSQLQMQREVILMQPRATLISNRRIHSPGTAMLDPA